MRHIPMRRLMILLSSLLIPSCCLKTEIIGYDSVAIDTIVVKSHKPFPKPIEPDTTRVSIGFSPSVEDWEQKDVDITK